jgi:hypothetical protein
MFRSHRRSPSPVTRPERLPGSTRPGVHGVADRRSRWRHSHPASGLAPTSLAALAPGRRGLVRTGRQHAGEAVLQAVPFRWVGDDPEVPARTASSTTTTDEPSEANNSAIAGACRWRLGTAGDATRTDESPLVLALSQAFSRRVTHRCLGPGRIRWRFGLSRTCCAWLVV